jgi:ferritin-like metal-binding protein YciE
LATNSKRTTKKKTKLADPRELLLHDLRSVLKMEKQLAKVLPRMQRAATDQELVERIETHVDETARQIENIEKAFAELDAKPRQGPAEAIDALVKEFRDSTSSVDKQLKDVVVAGVSARVEHYEIGAYENLIELARAVGERKVVKLLQDNLKEEKEMLRDGQRAAKRIGKERATAAAAA